MVDLRGFDANAIEPAGEFEPIPAGKYLAVITESDMRPTKSGNGNCLYLTFQIIEGPYQNRLVWARLNIEHANEMTERIAKSELAAICRAVGVMTPKDSIELHNLPLVIHVRCKKREDTGEIINEIKGYSKKEATTAPKSASSTPPWRR